MYICILIDGISIKPIIKYFFKNIHKVKNKYGDVTNYMVFCIIVSSALQ